ncbi:hypothetical protein DER46DRAFT_645630 [Fusarium sp. MPI-SDFR-AT-0072]|nr:hypothetical protein DER46DRAFT_645630 [Fusarium sp. MPI-SDFR-AT-0072]
MHHAPRQLRWLQSESRPGRMASATVYQRDMAGITTFWAIILVRAHVHVLEEGHGGPESRDPNAANLFTAFEDGEKVSEAWVGITQSLVGGLEVSSFQPYPMSTVELTNWNRSAQAKVEKSAMLTLLDLKKPAGCSLTISKGQKEQCTTGVMPQMSPRSIGRSDEPPQDLNPESHPDITGHRFLEVSWEGTLEWWWSPLQCLLVYEGRASLEPRDATVWLEFGA